METNILATNLATVIPLDVPSKTSKTWMPVLVPDIQQTAITINVPWFVRIGDTKTIVSVPQLSVHPIGVYVPVRIDETGDLVYSYQLWEERIVSWKTGTVSGKIKYYKPETWYERKVVYMPSQMQKEIQSSQAMIGVAESRIRNWEKVSMVLFGGSYEEVNIIATTDSRSYSVISAKFNGISGLIPSLLGNISLSKIASQ
jgi:hypothetical protein